MTQEDYLELVRLNLKLDGYYDDDLLLEQYISAAIEEVQNRTRRTSEELAAIGGGSWPSVCDTAVVLIVSERYRNRDHADSAKNYELAVERLLRKYRKLS